jgi:hypothetical protein
MRPLRAAYGLVANDPKETSEPADHGISCWVEQSGYATFTFQKSGAANLSTSRTLLRKAVR